MFGGVGCGKTMLMDLLVASAPKEFQVGRAANNRSVMLLDAW
jgi:predicted ATPase